jgi:hypothetical protein
MKHTYIDVVILQSGSGMRILGQIQKTHQKAFEECLSKGLQLAFPIFNTRIIITPKVGGKTILVPK